MLQDFIQNNMKPKEVEPTLDYLKALSAAGLNPIDVWASTVDIDLHLVRVCLPDRTIEFVIKCGNDVFMAHYRQAIEYCGFGPRGLSNLVYADAVTFAKGHKIKNTEVEIRVSKECAERLGTSIQDYMSYGLTFTVSSTHSGLSYTIHQK